MRLNGFALAVLLLTGCASFEPRVSVETHENRPSHNGGQRSATPPPSLSASAADYTVVRGDTLYGIAFRNKLDFRDFAAWNNINSPHTIYPGQRLRLAPASPTTRVTTSATTPISSPTVSPVTTPNRPASDTGNTQTYAILDDSAAASTASPSAAIGLPASAPKPLGSTPMPMPMPMPVTPAPAIPAVTTPVIVPATLPVAVDTAPRAVVDPNAPIRSRDGVRWRWPAGGQIIGRFVEGDPTQQGIDISGRLGQSVLAAADGEVVYSGNGLIGYGELVIVQHSPGFLSAYGHNQKRLVLEGSTVKAGQPIAEMGRRSGIDMLHFEVRRNGKPVDPLGFLPSR